MMIKTNHTFHMVDNSPWPIMSSFLALLTTMNFTIWFNTKINLGLIMSLLLTSLTAYQWWRDISRESSFQGLHPISVAKNMKLGMVLFIVSEVFFFLSFFWAFFHSSLAPNYEIGLAWPPLLITPFNPMEIPLLNTMILLSSGVSITWAHHCLITNNMENTSTGLTMTLFLGVYFSILQGMEYIQSPFSFSDSIYGSCFFLATGFHGIHVIIGSTFILITWMRLKMMSSSHHLGFEMASWYWHFVDVVWLFLYLSIYWWGM